MHLMGVFQQEALSSINFLWVLLKLVFSTKGGRNKANQLSLVNTHADDWDYCLD